MEAIDVSELREGLANLGGPALAGRLVHIERAIRSLEAAAIAVIAEADRRAVYGEDGHASVRGWVHATIHGSDTDVRDRVRTARLTIDVPTVAEALAEGRVGIAQVRELARARANRRCGDQLADVIDPMLDIATTQPYPTFVQVVRDWERLADADGAHRSADHTHDARHAAVTDVDGTTYLSGMFASAQGAAIKDVFDAYVRAEFLADLDDVRTRHGADAGPELMERSDRQRRADALVAIFTAAAAVGGSDGIVPTVDLVIDRDVYEEQLAAMVEDRSAHFTTDGRQHCRTAAGTPVDPADAVAASLVGYVRRVVLDGDGVIIDLGRRHRCFSGSARAAALLQAVLDRTGGCLWPGCRHRHPQVDHTIPWAHDGPTDHRNGGPLCPRHNRWKTHGYRTWRDADGSWHVQRPDGTTLDAA